MSSPNNLVKFPVKSKRGRPRKTGADYRVSVEQVSKRTCAVRLRWMRADGVKDGVLVNRLHDDIVGEATMETTTKEWAVRILLLAFFVLVGYAEAAMFKDRSYAFSTWVLALMLASLCVAHLPVPIPIGAIAGCVVFICGLVALVIFCFRKHRP